MFVRMEITEIRKNLEEKVKSIDPIGKKLKFNLDGEIVLIDGSNNLNIVTDKDEDADCTITMSKETYLKLQRREIKPMIATLTGKLKVKGDIGVAQKLKQLM
jgi:putative sterol carrier protein